MELQGKVALILGVGDEHSIGRAIAIELAKQGCHLALVGSEHADVAETVDLAFQNTDIAPLRISAHVVCGNANLACNVDRNQLHQEVLQEHPEINIIIVGGAGGTKSIYTRGTILNSDTGIENQMEIWESAVSGDIQSTTRWIREFLPSLYLNKQSKQSICLLLSDNAFWPFPTESALNCSHHAKLAFMESLQVECEHHADHIQPCSVLGIKQEWLVSDVGFYFPKDDSKFAPSPIQSTGVEPIPQEYEYTNPVAVHQMLMKNRQRKRSSNRPVFTYEDTKALKIHKGIEKDIQAAAIDIVNGIKTQKSRVVVGVTSRALDSTRRRSPTLSLHAAYHKLKELDTKTAWEQTRLRTINFLLGFWLLLCLAPLFFERMAAHPYAQATSRAISTAARRAASSTKDGSLVLWNHIREVCKKQMDKKKKKKKMENSMSINEPPVETKNVHFNKEKNKSKGPVFRRAAPAG